MSYELQRREPRSLVLAYLLWLPMFFGVSGLHRFYTGRWISGVVWLLTGGLCGIGQLVDLFFIPRMVEDHNEGRKVW